MLLLFLINKRAKKAKLLFFSNFSNYQEFLVINSLLCAYSIKNKTKQNNSNNNKTLP